MRSEELPGVGLRRGADVAVLVFHRRVRNVKSHDEPFAGGSLVGRYGRGSRLDRRLAITATTETRHATVARAETVNMLLQLVLAEFKSIVAGGCLAHDLPFTVVRGSGVAIFMGFKLRSHCSADCRSNSNKSVTMTNCQIDNSASCRISLHSGFACPVCQRQKLGKFAASRVFGLGSSFRGKTS